jgi:nucleoside-diphosphate-sugar epimerase
MNILITGATGFIGQRLTPALLTQGHTLYATQRPTASPSQFPKELHPIPLDDTLTPQASLPNLDAVIHLAARAHILNDPSPNPEADFFKVNTQGTVNLAKAALAAGAQQFIFISSIGAMATLSPERLTEETPCQPDTPYGRSKLAAEQALIDLAQGSPMAYTILRPTLVYGPGNPGNMERLLKLIQRQLPLPLGAIHNQRSLIYVDNLIDAILTTLNHPHAKNQRFLVSDGQDLSTPELIRRLAHYLNCTAPLLPIPPTLMQLAGRLTGKTDAVSRLLGSLTVDSAKIRHTLDWQPPYGVDQGLQATAEWFCGRGSG